MPDHTKKRRCAKCNQLFWVDKHHILPKCTFKGAGVIVELCPNCHRDYHEYLGRDGLKNPDKNFHYRFFARWMAGLLTLIAMALWWF